MSLCLLELLFGVLRRLNGDQISVLARNKWQQAGATLSSYLYGSSELSTFKGNRGGFFLLDPFNAPLPFKQFVFHWYRITRAIFIVMCTRQFDTKKIARSHRSSETGCYCELHTKISSCYNEPRSCLNLIF